MNGKEFRLRRLLSRSEKLVIAALDHGAFCGPLPGLQNPRKACLELAGADGVLMAPGILKHVVDGFTQPGSPWLLTRLVWNSNYCFQWDYNQGYHRELLSVSEAVAL